MRESQHVLAIVSTTTGSLVAPNGKEQLFRSTALLVILHFGSPYTGNMVFPRLPSCLKHNAVLK